MAKEEQPEFKDVVITRKVKPLIKEGSDTDLRIVFETYRKQDDTYRQLKSGKREFVSAGEPYDVGGGIRQLNDYDNGGTFMNEQVAKDLIGLYHSIPKPYREALQGLSPTNRRKQVSLLQSQYNGLLTGDEDTLKSLETRVIEDPEVIAAVEGAKELLGAAQTVVNAASGKYQDGAQKTSQLGNDEATLYLLTTAINLRDDYRRLARNLSRMTPQKEAAAPTLEDTTNKDYGAVQNNTK